MRARKVDANQKAIVEALRKAGASVAHTHMVGDGFPDIVVGFLGHNYLLEIKDGDKPMSATKLTRDEEEFRAHWRGQYWVVFSVQDALNAIGVQYSS